MKTLTRLWYNVKLKFLTVFGDIKVFKWPLFIVYDPTYFKMTGEKILEVTEKILPGDVVLRGYDAYLDGMFITSKRSYSHAGIYIGDNKLIHAVAPCVSEINIIEFCECDRIAVLRPRKYAKSAIKLAKSFLDEKTKYDFNFEHGKETLYCFELAYECYKKLDIRRLTASIFGGLIKKKEKVVLSDSFLESKDFKLVFEYNPKYGIDVSE